MGKVFWCCLISLLVLASCQSGREVRVYEKIPHFAECRKYTDYHQIVQCEQKLMGPLNREVNHVLRQSKRSNNRRFEQYRCQDLPNVSEPSGDLELSAFGTSGSVIIELRKDENFTA